MTPKTNGDNNPPDSTDTVDDADLQELQAVNESLDALSNALDSFEARTDNIIVQLKELLHSNREIRQELALEKEAAEKDKQNAVQNPEN